MAASASRNAKQKESDRVGYPMGIAHIYKGTLVSLRNDGYLYPSRSGTSTDVFVGVAFETIDNSGGAAGAVTMLVYKRGTFVFAKASAVQADLGLAHYASADDTLTQTSTNNQLVGYACELIDTANLRIRIDLAAK